MPKFHSLSLVKYRNVFWMFCRWRMVRRKRASRRQRTRGTPSPSSSCLISWTEFWVQVQVQVNAESKFFLSHIVNSDNQKVPENQGSQNKAESKLIMSHIMNSNNVNGSNNKRRNQVQVKLVFYVILCTWIIKSIYKFPSSLMEPQGIFVLTLNIKTYEEHIMNHIVP